MLRQASALAVAVLLACAANADPPVDTTQTIRVYDDRAFATDVTAVVTRCADGRQVITALVIGGQLTPLANRCPEAPATEPPPGPRCDANRWTCAKAP